MFYEVSLKAIQDYMVIPDLYDLEKGGTAPLPHLQNGIYTKIQNS
jgi:hypothetical protein